MTRAERSFDRLYRRHQRDVYRYALAVLRNEDDAEDVVQQTFLNAYRALQQGVKPQKPQHWLIKIAHNVCRQRFRDSSRRPAEVELNEELAPAVEPGALTAAEIQQALGHLTFNQRAALVARELEGRSYAEIAVLLDLSESAIETLLFRARRALREHLEGDLTCAQAEESLSRELDDELPRAEQGPLRAHLRECAECARLARSMRARRRALRGLLGAPLPWWGWSAPAWFGAGAKAAAVVCAGTVAVGVGVHEIAVQKPPAARADTKRFVPHDPAPVRPQAAPRVTHALAASHTIARPHHRAKLVHTSTKVVRHTTPHPPTTTVNRPPPPPAAPAPVPPPQHGKACQIHGKGHDGEHGKDELKC